MKPKIKIRGINKSGKLFNVKHVAGTTFVVEVNRNIMYWVGEDDKEIESYLRKSFRNFYNLDEKLKANTRKGQLKVNKPILLRG